MNASNQAMQLTASKPGVYAFRVCRRERMLRGMHRGLTVADLVSRRPLHALAVLVRWHTPR